MASPAQGMTDPQKECALASREAALHIRAGNVRRELLKFDQKLAECAEACGLSPVKNRAMDTLMNRHHGLLQKQKDITVQLSSATHALDKHVIKRQGAKPPLIASPQGSGLVPESPVAASGAAALVPAPAAAVAAAAARGAGSSRSSTGTGLTARELFSMADGDGAAVDAAAPAPAPAGAGPGAGAGSGVSASTGLLASPHGSGIVAASPPLPAAAAGETGERGHEDGLEYGANAGDVVADNIAHMADKDGAAAAAAAEAPAPTGARPGAGTGSGAGAGTGAGAGSGAGAAPAAAYLKKLSAQDHEDHHGHFAAATCRRKNCKSGDCRGLKAAETAAAPDQAAAAAPGPSSQAARGKRRRTTPGESAD